MPSDDIEFRQKLFEYLERNGPKFERGVEPRRIGSPRVTPPPRDTLKRLGDAAAHAAPNASGRVSGRDYLSDVLGREWVHGPDAIPDQFDRGDASLAGILPGFRRNEGPTVNIFGDRVDPNPGAKREGAAALGALLGALAQPPEPSLTIEDFMYGGGVSAPDLAAMLAPYDQAEATAREAAEVAAQVIGEAYDNSASQLDRNRQEFLAAREAADQQNLDRRASSAEQLNSLLAPSGLAESLGLAPELGAMNDSRMALAQLGADASDRMSDSLDASASNMHVDRLDQEALSRSNSLAAAQQNLAAILNQIGLGRAQAEAQHTQLANQAANQNAQMRAQAARDFAAYQAQKNEQAIQLAEAEAQAAMSRGAERAKSAPTSRQLFDSFVDETAGMNSFERLKEFERWIDIGEEEAAKANKARKARGEPTIPFNRAEMVRLYKAQFGG